MGEDYKTVAITITTTRFEKMLVWTADAVHVEIPMTVTVGINDDVHAAKVFVVLDCADMKVIGKLTTVMNEITLLDMDVRFILTEAVIDYRFAVITPFEFFTKFEHMLTVKFVPFNCIVKMNVNEMVTFDVLLDVTDEVIHCNVALITPLEFLTKFEHDLFIQFTPITWVATMTIHHIVATPIADFEKLTLTVVLAEFDKMMIITETGIDMTVAMKFTAGLNDELYDGALGLTLKFEDMTLALKTVVGFVEETYVDLEIIATLANGIVLKVTMKAPTEFVFDACITLDEKWNFNVEMLVNEKPLIFDCKFEISEMRLTFSYDEESTAIVFKYDFVPLKIPLVNSWKNYLLNKKIDPAFGRYIATLAFRSTT